jgi:hypothetical protein
MSFDFEFVATRKDAGDILEEETAPEAIKEVLRRGLIAFNPESLVRVKAVGHLFNGDYQRSNADLIVEQVSIRTPKARGS